MLAAAGVFILVVPAVLYLGSRVLAAVNIQVEGIQSLIKLSFLIGALVIAVLAVLIVIEQIQDALLYRAYQKSRDRRIQLSDGYSECPYCGNRKVREFDPVCPTCGKKI